MRNVWQVLSEDPSVHLGENSRHPGFQKFIEGIPEALREVLDSLCTLETLMQAQYLCIDALAKHSPKRDGALAKIRSSLSQYGDAQTFLWALGMSEKDYCVERSGMSAEEYASMREGKLYIRGILNSHPAVILNPLLKELKTLH